MIHRTVWVLLLAAAAFAQAPADPAYEPLDKAYAALRVRAYDDAISLFQKAIDLVPKRAAIRKDLGYTYRCV